MYRVCYYHANKHKRASRRFLTRKEFESFLAKKLPYVTKVECWRKLALPKKLAS